ncbi:hypothetical protein AB0I61_19375 [Polymorphospora rubra]|uniref:hypothetical protein n=1 Tax=Polymorphospora rubra TaxID=338584 RepID=UPI0033C7AFB3
MQPRQTAPDKRIITDDDAMFRGLTGSTLAAEQARMKTPKALKARLAEDHRRFRLGDVRVRSEGRPFDGCARVEVLAAEADAKMLRVRVEVCGNPADMCAPHDLVPVYLESAPDRYVFMIALLEPTADQNVFTIEFTYPVVELVRALGVEPGPKALELLKRDCPELGVTAEWLADTRGRGNDPDHVSGGVLEKGGSGKIFLRERTRADFVASETVRNLEWTMAERLSAGRGRPVFASYDSILAPGRKLATTLEAESEYQVDQRIVELVTRKMDALRLAVTTAGERIEEFGRSGPEDTERPTRPYQLVSMTRSVKTCTDHYLDLVAPGPDPAYPLLANDIVLRRRMVDGDPVGTYLLSVKGRTVENGGERIRLAAQINLIGSAMATRRGVETLGHLLRDDVNVDNAFARVLHDVLDERGLTTLLKQDWAVRHVLTVVSERWRYTMRFDDATVIDFSADRAVGRRPDGGAEATVCGFEFGVGHPGLTAGGTPTAMSMRKRIGQWDSHAGIAPTPTGARTFESRPRPITRPYHVPADLDSVLLFGKADFNRYRTLRDALIREQFGLDRSTLVPGGNKATVLAHKLGMIRPATGAPPRADHRDQGPVAATRRRHARTGP